jgi:hypothetical protein
MNLQYILVKKKSELIKYQHDVLRLFEKCFNKELDADCWQWAYLRNPIGDPIVSLCFNESRKLIGHYAIIPYLLEKGSELIKVGLSMTTMVDRNYRNFGVFIKQAKSVYEIASNENYKMLIAFPNKNAAPVFKTFLGWKLDTPWYITEVSKVDLSCNFDLQEYLQNRDTYEFAKSSTEFLKWRLSKPNCKYDQKSTVILKEFGKNKDIVYMEKGFENDLLVGQKYNFLVDGKWEKLISEDAITYQFGYKLFDKRLEPIDFKKDLILSDVF